MSENLIKQFHCDWPYCGTTADQPAALVIQSYVPGQYIESSPPTDWTIYDGSWYCPLHKLTVELVDRTGVRQVVKQLFEEEPEKKSRRK